MATERYETLRRQSLTTPERSAAELGLAVLVHRGVAAWLSIAPSSATPSGVGDDASPERPSLAKGGLVGCIAQMVLGRRTA